MDQLSTYVFLGLLALGVGVLVWSIYHAGKNEQVATDAVEAVKEVVEQEKRQDEIERESKVAAREAVAAGAAAGSAPSDPDSLPDEVRARILGPRG